MNIKNMNKLVEFLESDYATRHFSMTVWIKTANLQVCMSLLGQNIPDTQQAIEETACCIGGWAQVMHMKEGHKRYKGAAEDYLGIDRETAHQLFYPTCPYIYLKDPKLAAKVLRHLVETGEVDWSIIDGDLAEARNDIYNS